MKPLSQLTSGSNGIVMQLFGGHDFTARLATLGFTLGTELVVIQNRGNGPVLIGVRGTRIALGRGEAHKILVNET